MVYSAIILVFTAGWFSIKHFRKEKFTQDVSVSVIIPLKNEEANITFIFKDLISQDYNPEITEIIFIDDNSDDASLSILSALKLEHAEKNIIILQTEKDSYGKKNAIEKAVQQSSGKLILTTDADCRTGKSWISSIVENYKFRKSEMISGPVCFHPVKGFFGMFQAVEFLSLVGSGAGSVKAGIPIMCNGANLAYEREAFEKVNGYSGNKNFESGDDIFLLQKIKKNFGNRAVQFLKDPDAIVRTNPAKNLKEFLNQRKRWVSKSSGYTDFWMIFTSLGVYLFNLITLISFILSIFLTGWIEFALILFGIKFIVDLPILIGISKFSMQSKYLWFYTIFQVLYIPYVVIIGILGIFFTYKWK